MRQLCDFYGIFAALVSEGRSPNLSKTLVLLY